MSDPSSTTRRSARRSRWSAATSDSSAELVDEYRADGANRVADMRTALAAGAPRTCAAPPTPSREAAPRSARPASRRRAARWRPPAREGRLDGLGPRVDAIAAQFDAVVCGARGPGRERRMSAEPTVGRILVVDDNPVDRALLVRFLAGEGHEAIEADSGARALELLRQDAAVDLVLLDLLMPGLDGFETLATIKGDAALAALPVIVISGLDELDCVVRCIETGAADYLLRPFQPALLRATDRRLPSARSRLRETIERQRDRARPVRLAPDRGARLESRGRAAPGRPSPSGHRAVRRPARLHQVLRDGRAGGAARGPARLPRRDGRDRRQARRDARALRR